MTMKKINAYFTPSNETFSNWYPVKSDTLLLVALDNSSVIVDVKEAKRLLSVSPEKLHIASRQWIDQVFKHGEEFTGGKVNRNRIAGLQADSNVPAILMELPEQITQTMKIPENTNAAVIIDGFKRLAKVHASSNYMSLVTIIPAELSALIVVAFEIDENMFFREDAKNIFDQAYENHGIDKTEPGAIEKLFDALEKFSPTAFINEITT